MAAIFAGFPIPQNGSLSWLALSVFSVFVPCLLTYLYTSLRAQMTLWSKKDGIRPPIDPYFWPLIGHAYSFVVNLKPLYQYLM